MIKVLRLNMKEVVINADLIEYVEATPDVVISLTTGNKIVVRNSLDEIVERVVEYKARTASSVFNFLQQQGVGPGGGEQRKPPAQERTASPTGPGSQA